MSEAVIVALITGLCAVAGQWIISHQSNERRKVEDAVRDARQEDRLTAIERKIDIHNGYAEKFSEIQTDIAVIKNEIANLRGE